MYIEFYVFNTKFRDSIVSGNRTPIITQKSIVLSYCNFSTRVLGTDGCLPSITDLDFEDRLPQRHPLQKAVLGELTLDRAQASQLLTHFQEHIIMEAEDYIT